MVSSPKKLSCEYRYLKVVNFIYNIFINYDYSSIKILMFIFVYVRLHICTMIYLDSKLGQNGLLPLSHKFFSNIPHV